MSNKADISLTKTYFGGRFVTGPDNAYFYITLVMMYAPHVPFIVLICTYFDDKMSAVVYVIPGYILLFSTVMLLCAAFTDPGIVPRGKPISDDNPFAPEKSPMVKKVNLNGMELETKWCDTCGIYRPIRTSHCGICNNCVQNFDHHCPWVGNCIGKRNYRYYLLFILSGTIDCLYVISLSIAHIVLNVQDSDKESRGDRVRDGFAASYYFAIILPVYSVAAMGFIGGLTGFHIFLVGKGVSTNEFIKKTFRNRRSPHSHGVFRNYLHALCGPWYPTFYSSHGKNEISTAPTSAAAATTNV